MIEKTKKDKGYEIPVKYDHDREGKLKVNTKVFVFSHFMETYDKRESRMMPFVVWL